jgi:hypothetical protein
MSSLWNSEYVTQILMSSLWNSEYVTQILMSSLWNSEYVAQILMPDFETVSMLHRYSFPTLKQWVCCTDTHARLWNSEYVTQILMSSLWNSECYTDIHVLTLKLWVRTLHRYSCPTLKQLVCYTDTHVLTLKQWECYTDIHVLTLNQWKSILYYINILSISAFSGLYLLQRSKVNTYSTYSRAGEKWFQKWYPFMAESGINIIVGLWKMLLGISGTFI